MQLIKYLAQANNMSHKLINTIPFIIKNKLWEGFFQHKIVMIVSIISAIAIPWSILKYLGSKIESYQETPTTVMGALNSGMSLSSLMDGGNKYLALILIQMLAVYFSNKTIEHISGVTIHMSIREMVDSQIRVIKLSIRNWAFELVIGIGVSIVLGIFGPDWLEAPAKFVIACYFVGFIFMDNYNHAYAIKIKDSAVIV
ncbi:MAG: hypothetical protein WBO36_10590, partial [Saprospiraceae bacterium]